MRLVDRGSFEAGNFRHSAASSTDWVRVGFSLSHPFTLSQLDCSGKFKFPGVGLTFFEDGSWSEFWSDFFDDKFLSTGKASTFCS